VRFHRAIIVQVHHAGSRLEGSISTGGKFPGNTFRRKRKIGAGTGKHVRTSNGRKSGDIVQVLLIDGAASSGAAVKANYRGVLIRGERKLQGAGSGNSRVQQYGTPTVRSDFIGSGNLKLR